MTKYKHIFFDLDDTLWYYEKNSRETLKELYKNYKLDELDGFSVKKFVTQFGIRNAELWKKYKNGIIDSKTLRKERFLLTFNDLKPHSDFNTLVENIAVDYIKICPTKSQVIPFAHEALVYLKKKYQLHIITNGIEEIQLMKLQYSDLKKYFIKIITSENAGSQKPDIKVFEYALKKINATAQESIMIGDDLETDILGAKNSGIDQIFFNPNKRISEYRFTFEINCLSELLNIL